ncbi:MAG: hypothetical protein AABY04_01955 [Candidatus Micrarchaeota archaeon]
MGKLLLIIAAIAMASLVLSGCTSKRELKTAICFAKTQPSENKCLQQLAIDYKDAEPCKKIKTYYSLNKTISPPTKITCYSEVAYWKGEENICNQLSIETDKDECKYRYNLYMDAARVEN